MPTSYATEPIENGGRRQVLLTALFLVLALVLVNLPATRQQQVASVLRTTVLRPFVWTRETLAEAEVRRAESARLQALLDSMVAVSTSRTHLREENRRLRELLSLSRRIGPSWIGASAIRSGTRGSESMFQLDVGSRDGVEVNAPVITRQGLVGVIREVGDGTALGMDWTDPEFGASAMSADGVTYGLVESRRGDLREEDRLQFNGTAFQTSLERGTLVLTSGLGGVYPRGIPVGRVTELAEEDAGWLKSYWLEPMVDPGSVTHVLVATDLRHLPRDVSEAWPADSVLTQGELQALEESRLDSLGTLRDSVAVLLRRLQELAPPTDSSQGGAPPTGGGRRP